MDNPGVSLFAGGVSLHIGTGEQEREEEEEDREEARRIDEELKQKLEGAFDDLEFDDDDDSSLCSPPGELNAPKSAISLSQPSLTSNSCSLPSLPSISWSQPSLAPSPCSSRCRTTAAPSHGDSRPARRSPVPHLHPLRPGQQTLVLPSTSLFPPPSTSLPPLGPVHAASGRGD